MAIEREVPTVIDSDLTRRAFHDGDQVAYIELVGLLEPQLRRHARRLLGPDKRSDVDDLLQATFENLHRAVLEDDRPVEALAFVIMRHLCVDWYRAAKRRPRTVPELVEDIDINQPGQGDGGEEYARLLDLHNALLQLPLDRRRLIELVYFKGYPLSEAASKLKMTYGAARYQLGAAFSQLRAAPGLRDLEKNSNRHDTEDRDAR